MLDLQSLLRACVLLRVAGACTTILVGKGASADGSVFCSHTNDGEAATDPRLVLVEAKDHAPGAKRPVFFAVEDFPRYVGFDRGIPAYFPVGGQEPLEPLGFIDEVAHTFSYYEETYGALNEMHVGMGESTCSCVDWAALGGVGTEPCAGGGGPQPCALLSVDELTRLAMERASTAREAVQLMGDLAVDHGFYGEGSFEGSAESLMVTDFDDAWIFHVLPHPSGASAIWAAERIADDHVAVVANLFVVRNVNLTDSATFLGSDLAAAASAFPSLAETCASNDWCDFSRTFGGGEYAHKFYSGRRQWGMLRHLSPDTKLDADYPTTAPQWVPYPASVPVDPLKSGFRLGLQAILDAHRDHYEGTPFDLTRGLAAGPFGNPNRYGAGAGEKNVTGNWERAISLFRTSDAFVVQTRRLANSSAAVLWFGSHVPHATVFSPFPAGMLSLPSEFSTGVQGTFEPTSALWRTRVVHTLMDLKFGFIVQDVQKAQRRLEGAALKFVEEYLFLGAPMPATALTSKFSEIARANLQGWRDLFDLLLFKYADGWVNVPKLGDNVGYPQWWLEEVGYEDGPPPLQSR